MYFFPKCLIYKYLISSNVSRLKKREEKETKTASQQIHRLHKKKQNRIGKIILETYTHTKTHAKQTFSGENKRIAFIFVVFFIFHRVSVNIESFEPIY